MFLFSLLWKNNFRCLNVSTYWLLSHNTNIANIEYPRNPIVYLIKIIEYFREYVAILEMHLQLLRYCGTTVIIYITVYISCYHTME